MAATPANQQFAQVAWRVSVAGPLQGPQRDAALPPLTQEQVATYYELEFHILVYRDMESDVFGPSRPESYKHATVDYYVSVGPRNRVTGKPHSLAHRERGFKSTKDIGSRLAKDMRDLNEEQVPDIKPSCNDYKQYLANLMALLHIAHPPGLQLPQPVPGFTVPLPLAIPYAPLFIRRPPPPHGAPGAPPIPAPAPLAVRHARIRAHLTRWRINKHVERAVEHLAAAREELNKIPPESRRLRGFERIINGN